MKSGLVKAVVVAVSAWTVLFGAEDARAAKKGPPVKGCQSGSIVQDRIPVVVTFHQGGIQPPEDAPPDVDGVRADDPSLTYTDGEDILAVIDCNGELILGRVDVQNADSNGRQIVLDFRTASEYQGDGRCTPSVDCKSDELFAETGGQVQWYFSLDTRVYGDASQGDALNADGTLVGGMYAMDPNGSWRLARLRVQFCDPTAPLGRAKFCYAVRFTGGGSVGNPQNIPGYDETTPALITRLGDTWTIQASSAVSSFCYGGLCAGDIANLRASAFRKDGPTHEGNYVMPATSISIELKPKP